MGKGHRHQKNLKSERGKIKLKAKKVQHLPKGLNVTDTTFKVKKIVIREQLKHQDETEILSQRKLSVKDLLTRLQHYNSTIRQEAIRELKEILPQHSAEILNSQLNSLLQGICALSLDKERDIRRNSLKVLNLILTSTLNDQLLPFFDILISYLKCAMTHIDPKIKEDSLFFLDVLLQNCSSLLAKNSHKILPSFLDMISRLSTEYHPGRQLTTTLNSKNTSIKWRVKVLQGLGSIFRSIINERKSQNSGCVDSKMKMIHVDKRTRYIPIFNPNNLEICQLNLDINDSSKNDTEESLDLEELIKYIKTLIPLMFDSWIEVSPKEKATIYTDLVISNEASSLLKNILDIMQSVIEYIEMSESECDTNATSVWFKNNFQDAFVKSLFSKFPYIKMTTTVEKQRKRQDDFEKIELNVNCLEQNLAICHIYVWFTLASVRSNTGGNLNTDLCTRVIEYLNDTLDNWCDTDTAALPQLMRLVKTLLLRASKIWYKGHIPLGETLRMVINAYLRQPKRELQSQLFTVLSEIVLDHNLTELHSEETFKEFVTSLPDLLLKHSIYDNTILMLNRVILQYREWIEKELVEKQEAIIQNAKIIEIIGSEDEKRSRLTICNLFSFLDTLVYY